VPNLRIRDAGREYTFQIDGDAATVGRGDTNDVDLEDAKASKEHFRIERVGQRWKLVDLESKNGTRVNGEFKNKAWLGHGDLVQVGASELRFGLEGTVRAARAAAPPAGDEAAEGEEEEAPRRYARKSNAPLIFGLSSLGLLLLYVLTVWIGGTSNNKKVLIEGNKLAEQGDYGGAIQYMDQWGEPDEDDYIMIERRLTELRERKIAYDKMVREREANEILSKAGLLIVSYNRGHTLESGPDKILPLMKQLRETYAGTDASEAARKQYPAWFAGKVPQPASELLAAGGRLSKDWDAAVARSEDYRKEWAFREAKETVERFVTEREAILDADTLAAYEQYRDEELLKIDRLAESIYRGREAEAARLLKIKRYDEAIAVYQKVVEKFGIDAWVRKAQGEIAKIQQMKPSGG